MKCVVKKVAIPGYRLCLLHLCKTKQQQSTFFLSCDFGHVVDCDHMTMILPITFWSSDLAPEALTFAKIRPPNIQPVLSIVTDMRFVKNFTPPDFQAKNFTPLISPNFNSFGDKNTKKMSRNGEIYTTGKNGSDGSDKSHLCSSCGNEFLFQYSLLVQIARSSLFVIMFCNSPESCKMQLMWAISIAAKWGAKKFCLICLYCLVI